MRSLAHSSSHYCTYHATQQRRRLHQTKVYVGTYYTYNNKEFTFISITLLCTRFTHGRPSTTAAYTLCSRCAMLNIKSYTQKLRHCASFTKKKHCRHNKKPALVKMLHVCFTFLHNGN